MSKAGEQMQKKMTRMQTSSTHDPLIAQKNDEYAINKARIWEQQIDVDEQKGNNGITAVFFAIRFDNLAVLRQLSDYGADFNIECKIGDNQKMRPI